MKLHVLIIALITLFTLCLWSVTGCGNGNGVPGETTVDKTGSGDATSNGNAGNGNNGNGNSATNCSHNYKTTTTDATCTEEGRKVITCSRCGDTTTHTIPPTGHDYQTNSFSATCTEDGGNVTACSRCGDIKTSETIPATGIHTYKNGVCSQCGEKEPMPSQGLAFALNADRRSYRVTGLGTCKDKNIIIPATYENLPVTGIGNGAFSEQPFITSVTIPDSVTSIGSEAFKHCNLHEIVIPDSVTTIGDKAFWNANLPSDFTIPDGVTGIGSYAFAATNLKKLIIPDSVRKIEYYAFGYCYHLTSVTIPNSVSIMGDYVFFDCPALVNVYCKAESKPSSWKWLWLGGSTATVHWGYTGN